MLVIGAVTPVVVKGYAGFPWKRVPYHVSDSFRWYHLLRGSKVA